MKRPLILLALIPLGFWGIFALPEVLAANPTFWEWRKALIILTGTLALWWMSAGIALAARPAWLEKHLGGLDKLYRLHKYIGIGSGILVFSHWMMEWLPKKMAKLGWVPSRPRGPKGMQDMWLSLAKDVGEWAGYILLALVVIALVRRIPYRYFRLVHKAFGLIFLAGVFHGLILMPATFWQNPLGWLTATMAAAGAISALLSLSNRIGRNRQHPAQIVSINQHEGKLLEIVCRPTEGWPGHRAGQFLFADFGQRGEGAHPFTIASAWNSKDGTLTLAIKALGDFTTKLPVLVQPGQMFLLEGPYGSFDFSPSTQVDRAPQEAPLGCNKLSDHQVWIAGGIGITPFLARLNELANADGKKSANADLFYCTPDSTAGEFPAHLEALCQSAGVRLHRRLTEREGPLSSHEVASTLQAGSSVWFCGPAAWGKSLGKALHNSGLSRTAFHQEAFEFR
ncbi:MAG: ferric reductase-like transmembrane domain-containing protein [Dechloromonas sp.]|uniref:Ferric reductase-like transmembrane domain-containing protein n=1 Tax=Candidatus Dechloromonas phosphorivorans TaxID=2899244 RepID=A0A935JY19_9RHOO|nr:ferric reductase-like transmembrane domain-containing protein [Candidatus Dechloromonas phosphorivorans]